MPQTPTLDSNYTEGVWYDMKTGDFCRIQRGYCEKRATTVVELVDPETGTVHYDMPVPVWRKEQSDFRQVSKPAVDDPKGAVCRALNIASRHDIAGDIDPVDLRYAWKQVEIQEK